MTEHVFDDLPGLLAGDADRATVASAAAHLRSCEDCRHELISAVVSHAALTSAMRFAPGLAMHDQAPREFEADSPLPDLSAMFAKVRTEGLDVPGNQSSDDLAGAAGAEASTGTSADAAARGGRTGHKNRARWLVAAAVAAVAIAGGSAVAITESGGPGSRSVALAAFGQGKTIDGGNVSGKAQLIGNDQVRLEAAALPALASDQYYEVWLTDSARVTVVPVGQLGAHGNGDFSIAPSVVSRYSAIEISVQNAASNGKFSNVSVLRGSYA